jgi:DNA-binding SARP family transcriptional activator
VLTAERDGQQLTNLPSRKVRGLLAYLLIHRRTSCAREQVAALFWPELDGDKARHCLNTTLWRLRAALRPLESEHPYLRVDAQSIGFNMASGVRLDVDEFESRCTLAGKLGPDAGTQQAELYHQALECYSGDLLTDCYDDWCLVERERLHLLYLRVLGRLLTYHARQREHDVAIDCAQRILARDPLREKVHRALIRLYLEANQPAAALRQYQVCEETVRRELGADVMPETRALLIRLTTPCNSRLVSLQSPTTQDRATADTTDGLSSELATALSRLRDAARMLDSLCTQLREAASLIEAVQRGAGTLGLAPPLRARGWDGAHDRPATVGRPLHEVLP